MIERNGSRYKGSWNEGEKGISVRVKRDVGNEIEIRVDGKSRGREKVEEE